MGSAYSHGSGLFIGAALLGLSAIPITMGLSTASGLSAGPIDHAAHAPLVHGLYYGDPLPGLPPELIDDYAKGLLLFSKFWSLDEGLGPRFNERSCATCHSVPMAGGSGVSPLTFVQHDPTVSDPSGGTVVQKYTATPDRRMTLELPGPDARLRKTPPLFGLGLLEAVPFDVIDDYADPDDRDGNGISGRLGGRNGKTYGRLGWKASSVDLDRFVGDALLTELGLTGSGAGRGDERVAAIKVAADTEPPEVSAEQSRRIAQFVRLLAAPPVIAGDEQVRSGERIFDEIGCSACHRKTLQTGDDFPSPAHRGIAFSPYSDLLLHDMGPDLADGIEDGLASGREFRTPPLWGLKSVGPPFLHDGRAKTIEDAVRLHGGEAEETSRRFATLRHEERADLIRFLETR